ncbi:auracyanin [Oscillochloris sp. ZM17-4]|uniref:plastocyanin/azurin family copper-binding protein n=1 Tax=Oscillochloris sp. ZM17-4 TaxID=2866714 RepID=UPI001C73AF54|nr:plastocyanin/azurin family copper-binding protein [Oscillochloris sp. ZM17-4]MBX0329264.1 auracyanin [Oscillochloris sp. ZM17-4]
MKTHLRLFLLSAVLGVSLLLTACGGSSTSTPAASSGGTGPVTLELGSAGENLAFDKTELSVSSGQQVTVKFTDNSAAQQHNWVLARGGDDVAQKIATEGLVAGADKNYLPTDPANIIANTTLANAGQTVEVTFTAPAPGTYTFFCTVPGHYPLMKGVLTVN